VSHSFNLKVGGRTIPELLAVDLAMATEDHRKLMWRDKYINNATGLMVVKPDGGLTFRVETYKHRVGNDSREVDQQFTTSRELDVIDMPLRPYCPICDRYAVTMCKPDGAIEYGLHERSEALTEGNWSLKEEDFRDLDEHGFQVLQSDREQVFNREMKTVLSGKVDVTNEHILREAAYFAEVRKLNRLVFVDSSTYVINNAASNEQKILEEFTVDTKQCFAPGSRALLVIDLDSFSGLTFSESEGGVSSKSYNLGSPLLFGAAISAFERCRASFKEGDSTIRTTDPNLAETESWCVAIIRSDYLMRLFRERTQWPLSVQERKKQEEEEKEQDEVECARCMMVYREADNKDLPGNCQYHPCLPVHIMSRPGHHGVMMNDVQLVHAMHLDREIAADQTRQKSEKVVFGCCGQPVNPRGGCCQTRHRPPGSRELPKKPSLMANE